MRKILDLTLGIPTYNSGQFLPDTFASITRQSYAPKQIIITDNCSTDDTVAQCHAFMKNNPDLNISVWVNGSNLGVAGNYNQLIEKSGNTRWFQILDSDDCFMNDYWSDIAPEIEADSDMKLIITGMRTTSAIVNTYLKAYESALLALRLRSIPNYVQVLGGLSGRSSLIYRTAAIKNLKFIDPIFDGSDIVHVGSFISHNVWRPQAKICYRIHEGSTTSQLHRNKAKLQSETAKYLNYIASLELRKRLAYTADFLLRKKLGALLRLR